MSAQCSTGAQPGSDKAQVAPTTQAPGESQQTVKSLSTEPLSVNRYTPAFPKRLDTKLAAVLAALLSGESLTQRDAYSTRFSTTRLAVAIFQLNHEHGWRGWITETTVSVACTDGHTSDVGAYFIAPSRIASLDAVVVADFIEAVAKARAEKRKDAPQAAQQAAASNRARQAARERRAGGSA